MGTRNLTMVKYNGEIKVAQYGQYDGYPSGQGLTALRLCRDKNKLDRLKASLVKLHFFTQQESNEFDKHLDLGDEKALRYYSRMLSRELGADVLQQIVDADDLQQIWLDDDYSFFQHGLFCEWAWCVNFDTDKLEAYRRGDNKVAEFDLYNLPTDDKFIDTFNQLLQGETDND